MPYAPSPKKDFVQIELKHLIFGQKPLHHDGERHILQLALDRLNGAGVNPLGQLHGEGRSAPFASAKGDGPTHGPQIDAGVTIKPLVFGGQNGVDHLIRDFDAADGLTIFSLHPEKQRTIGGQNLAGLARHFPHHIADVGDDFAGFRQLFGSINRSGDKGYLQDNDQQNKNCFDALGPRRGFFRAGLSDRIGFRLGHPPPCDSRRVGPGLSFASYRGLPRKAP